jgi:hypothetical protein
MGWSVWVCHQMAKLRAYHSNGGKMIDLLKYQKAKEKVKIKWQEQEELIREVRKRKAR